MTAYMVMFEVDDLDARMSALGRAQVRTVWSSDYPTIRGRHLHPGDIGGAIVSLDQAEPQGSWLWAGPAWTAHTENKVVTSIAGFNRHRRPRGGDQSVVPPGVPPFVQFTDGTRSEIELTATDRGNVGQLVVLDQVTLRLV